MTPQSRKRMRKRMIARPLDHLTHRLHLRHLPLAATVAHALLRAVSTLVSRPQQMTQFLIQNAARLPPAPEAQAPATRPENPRGTHLSRLHWNACTSEYGGSVHDFRIASDRRFHFLNPQRSLQPAPTTQATNPTEALRRELFEHRRPPNSPRPSSRSDTQPKPNAIRWQNKVHS